MEGHAATSEQDDILSGLDYETAGKDSLINKKKSQEDSLSKVGGKTTEDYARELDEELGWRKHTNEPEPREPKPSLENSKISKENVYDELRRKMDTEDAYRFIDDTRNKTIGDSIKADAQAIDKLKDSIYRVMVDDFHAFERYSRTLPHDVGEKLRVQIGL